MLCGYHFLVACTFDVTIQTIPTAVYQFDAIFAPSQAIVASWITAHPLLVFGYL